MLRLNVFIEYNFSVLPPVLVPRYSEFPPTHSKFLPGVPFVQPGPGGVPGAGALDQTMPFNMSPFNSVSNPSSPSQTGAATTAGPTSPYDLSGKLIGD